MIESKERPCKAIGNAKGFKGCGKLILKRTYGLCDKCYRNWLLTTKEGQEKLNKTIPRAKKKVKQDIRQEQRKAKHEAKKKSEWEALLQIEINAIVRLIDQGNGCISCSHAWDEIWKRQAQAGHYYSVGSNPTLRYNLFNIFLQCQQCNYWFSANEREYDKGIIKHYGKEMLDYIKSLPRIYKEIKLSSEELQQKLKIARKIKREILQGKNYTRKEINKKLKIY